MLYGRDARIPRGIDIEEVKSKPNPGQAAYLEDLKKGAEQFTQNLKKTQEKQEEHFDSRYRSKRSKASEKPYFSRFIRTRGLQEKYIGPYLNVVIRDGNYEIESLADKKRKIVHFDNLKPYKIDNEIMNDIRDDSESSSDESDIDEPIFDNKMRYLSIEKETLNWKSNDHISCAGIGCHPSVRGFLSWIFD